MGKKLNRFIVLTGISFTAIHFINKILNYTATLKNLTEPGNDFFYEFRYGKIHYKKTGSGDPILFIHDLDSTSSTFEWSHIIKNYEKTNTVYCIDLLGCGHSAKPKMIYTNYLYVQLLSDFIRDVIKEKPYIVSSGLSTSFSIMYANMYKDSIQKLILVNPVDLKLLANMPTLKTKFQKAILDLPIIGTFIYNILVHESRINSVFEKKYYYKSSLISSKFEDIYFESAHIGNGDGRYLLSSIISNYLNTNIVHALDQLPALYIIESRNLKDNLSTINQYISYNNKIETAYLSNSSYLPQLENPNKFVDVLNMFLRDS